MVGASAPRRSASERCVGFGAVLAIATLIPAATAAASGGYFPPSWGLIALAYGWIALIALVSERVTELGNRDAAFIGSFAMLAVWAVASIGWSSIVPQTMLEAERGLVLSLAAAAALLVVGRTRIVHMAAALLVACTVICVYSLATRVAPERFHVFDPVSGYRLATPLGYWNALGIFAAMGTLLALGSLARASGVTRRAMSAACLIVLVPTIYFTFSRGAWSALGLGICVALALDPQRLQFLATLLVCTPAVAVAVWLASRSDALTHQQAHLARAAHDGHRLAVFLVGLAVANAALATVLRFGEQHVALVPRVRRTLNILLVAGAIAVVFGGVLAAGGPAQLVRRTHSAFTASPPKVRGDLNQRLFSLSGTYRAQLWSAAWDDYRAHPLLGSGAGSYEQYWLQHRQIAIKVRDAHSLYLETLAELGPIGLLLLLVALVTPLGVLPRARHHSLGPVLAAAYVAFLVHAGVDWDWEMLAVTLTGLACGAGILMAARTGDERPLSQRVRVGGIVAVIALMAVAFVGLVGNIELSRAGTAARAGHWQTAARDARRAHSWAPWSSEPWQQLGEAQLGLGEQRAAQGSFHKAIAKSPKDWSLWFDLARASTGKAQVAALARAHRLNPLSPEIAELEKELAVQGTIGIVEK